MKKILIPVLGLLSCGLAMAQTIQTSYFSEDFTYSYRLNPAFHPRYSFVGLPVAGTSSMAYTGSFSMGDVIYKKGGEKVTFMNDEVQASDFLGRFKSGINKFSNENYVNLLAVGFKAGGMYNIVDFNIRNYATGALPYDLMRYLKEGPASDGSYDMSGLRAHATSFMEIGITSSWKPNRKLTVGMRFKGVIGLQNSYVDMDNLKVTKSGNEWTVSSSGVVASAYDGIDIATRRLSDTSPELIDFPHTKVGKSPGIMNGYGVGADLGILYDDSSWQFSASVSDIGCVFWFHNLYGHALSGSSFTYDYQRHSHRGSRMANEFSDMGDLMAQALQIQKEDEYQSLQVLPLTARFGAKYLLYSDLSFGGIATFRYDDICPFWDLRGSVNYKPIKNVELIGSLGAGTYGITLGAFANVKLGHFNLFAGTDGLLGLRSSNFVFPGRNYPNAAFGLNIIW